MSDDRKPSIRAKIATDLALEKAHFTLEQWVSRDGALHYQSGWLDGYISGLEALSEIREKYKP
jgi:hypothetical protein